MPSELLTKADTVALWHAVNWMGCVLSEWRKDGYKDDMDRAQHETQKALHLIAARALRKVNAIRKAQRRPMPDEQVIDGLETIGVTVWGPRAEDFQAGVRWAESCRSTMKVQEVLVQNKAAGAAGGPT